MNVDFSGSTSYSLLERSIAGETDAWTCLCEIYTPMVYKWVRCCGLQPDDASEITQKTFCKVFEKLGSFERGAGRFRGWLWTISRNFVRDLADERARRPRDIDPIAIDRLERSPPDADQTEVPPKEIVQRAMEYLLHDFDERTRSIIQGVIMQGRQAKYVAEELAISVNAVYIAKSRAIKKLRRLLADVEYPARPLDAENELR